MCNSPRYIDNPYKGLKYIGLNRLHDTTSLKIPVPCGVCPVCIALRQNYYIQRTQMESFDNHLFMLTLTYRDRMIRYVDVNGRKLYYADFTDVQKMFKRLRNRGLKFSYLIVSEYGSKRHRPHFHAILSVPKGPNDTYHDIRNLEEKLQNMFIGEWRRNYGSDKKPKYKDLCEKIFSFRGRTFDLHYVHPASTPDGEADVGFYVTKYLLKADKWVDKLKSALKLNTTPEKFIEVWKLLKPRACISKGFGNCKSPKVISHIRKGIELSKLSGSLFPFFINPVNGKTFPLAPYFQKRFLTLQDKFHFMGLSEFDDGYIETDERFVSRVNVAQKRLDNIRDMVNSRLQSHDFLYDHSEIENISSEALQENTCISDCLDSLPDDWQNDFADSF